MFADFTLSQVRISVFRKSDHVFCPEANFYVISFYEGGVFAQFEKCQIDG